MAASTNSSTPFFGCKISLISKSEIRYEGILYTIDPKESTIALAKVRSFGSEDRPVERPVPPRDDIFEFIIFRASDIKDLIVDDPPPAPQLTDPAIIQAQSSTSFPSSFPQGSSQAAAAAGVQLPTGPAPVAQQPKQTPLQQLQNQQQKKQQQQQQDAHVDGNVATAGGKPKQSTASNVAGASGYAKVAGGGGGNQQKQQGPSQPNQQQRQQQQNVPFKPQQKIGEQREQQQRGGERSGNQQSYSQPGQNGWANRRPQNNQNRVIGEGGNPNYHPRNNGAPGQHQQGFRTFNQRFNQSRGGGLQGSTGYNNRRGGYNNAVSGGGNYRSGNYQNRGPRNDGGLSGPVGPKFAPLPDGDFDFEKAATDFKILEEKLQALKLGAGAGGDAAPAEGGEPGADSTDVILPGIPLSAISVAALEEEELAKEPCYNKIKSFFDTISCEAIEREKGGQQRVDWKAERKTNRETFGIVSTRRPTFFRVNNRGGGGYHGHRGGYQAHRSGGYQNRNSSGGNSGGYNRGPRIPNSSNSVSSTTNGNATSSTQQPAQQRTPAKSPPQNGLAASTSPAVVAAKN